MNYRASGWFLAFFLPTAALSEDPQQMPRCGTSAATTHRVELLRQIPDVRGQRLASFSSPQIDLTDGMFIMRADDRTLFGDRPFDLHNSSLTFKANPTGYTVTKGASRFSEERGPLARAFASSQGDGWHYYTLHNVAFPFFGRQQPTIYISAFNAITFSPPELSDAEQFDRLEIAGHSPAVISPLLLTRRIPRRLVLPNLYVRQTADRVLIIWATPVGSRFSYEVQAILYRNGDIVFSYRDVKEISWGTPVISAGRDAWQVVTSVTSGTDAANDGTAATPAELKPFTDLQSLTLNRVNGSELLEARLKLSQPVVLSAIAGRQYVMFAVVLYDVKTQEMTYALVRVERDGRTFVQHPGRYIRNSGAARIEGDTIVLFLLQDGFAPEVTGVAAYTFSSATNEPADLLTVPPVNLGLPERQFSTDFSGAAEVPVTAIAFEPFTLPALDVPAVWEQVRQRYGISPESVDALAVYQTFFTDIIFYASAYAISGNPQADGVTRRRDYGTASPKQPTLMHMNVLDYSWNETPRNSGHVLLHELGHRWLYGIRIMEGTAATRSLNPVSEHPAQYVDTQAAFPVYSAQDASVMGGGTFRDNFNGTYTSSAEYSNYGYSWTDLYLMGLAKLSDLPPWFYIENSQPALGDEYYPPANITVTGTRRNVTIQQVIDAMGSRTPAEAQSQKNFRVYFVLLVRGDEPTLPYQISIVQKHREILEKTFREATGYRGIVSTFYSPPTRSRPVRR